MDSGLQTTEKKDYIAFMISIVFMILGLIYIILFFYTLYRLKKIIFQTNQTVIGRYCYLFVCLFCAIRLLFAIMTVINCFKCLRSKDENPESTQYLLQDLFYNEIYIPDVLFMVIFFAIFWEWLILYWIGHIRFGNIVNNDQCPPTHTRGLCLFQFLVFTFLIVQIIIIVLFNKGNMEYAQYLDTNNYMNIVFPFIYMMTHLIINVQFSGAPYKSPFFRAKLKYFLVLMWYIIITRLIHIGMNIFINHEEPLIHRLINFQENSSKTFDIFSLFGFISILVVSEVVPLMMLLNISTVKTFSIQNKASSDLMEIDSNLDMEKLLLDSESSVYQEEKQIIEKSIKQTEEDKQLANINVERSSQNQHNLKPTQPDPEFEDENQGQINFPLTEFHIDTEFSSRKQGMGQIHRARRKGSKKRETEFAIREMEVKELFPYTIQECRQEIQRLDTKDYAMVAQPKNFLFENGKCFIVYLYYENNLSDLINNNQGSENLLLNDEKDQLKESDFTNSQVADSNVLQKSTASNCLSIETQLKLAQRIAIVINGMHKINPPVYHGHLTPQNILIGKNFDIQISDVGFYALQKITSLMQGYENQSQYTAPEHLIEKGNIVEKPSATSDIYSFGLILWEIFNDAQPFKGLPLKEVTQIVVEDGNRPKISPDARIPEEIINIIQCCWQRDASQRCNLDTIIRVIKNCIEENVSLKKSDFF